MTKPQMKPISPTKPVLILGQAFIGLKQTLFFPARPSGAILNALMDDTSALMDDPVYLMGLVREQGGEKPKLTSKYNQPRMKYRTERPSMKNGIS